MKNYYIQRLLIFIIIILIRQLVFAQKINIETGTKLVMNNNVSLVVMNGDIKNNGTVIPGNTSSVYFKGNTSATMQGTATIDLNNLYVDNTASMPLTITAPVSVFGKLSLVNGTSTITTNDKLTLKSTATKTAMVATIPSGGDIAGKVMVERYIQAHRSWRLLTVPISSTGAPTINTAWQEGATTVSDNFNPGFGTHITGSTAPSNGFDLNSSKTTSCKEYITGVWSLISNTNVNLVTDQPGYMLFVRGSRANMLSLGTAAVSDATVLRASGNLNIGNRPSVAVAATGYTLIGNPYASPIDFATITRVNVPNTFYVWDPMLTGTNGVGGYVTVSYGINSYSVTTSVSPINQYIQSGSAFFVNSTGSAASVTIKESDKADQSSITVQRPQETNKQLRVDLSVVNADNSLSLYDAVLVEYDPAYSNEIDQYDAGKLSNGYASIAILRNKQSFAIERRQPIDKTINDTVFFKLAQLNIKNYSLRFSAKNLNYPNTVAFLVDSFLNTQTVLNLNDITTVPFSVTNTPASYASNRFKIIFKPITTLATTFTALSATEQNGDILIDWKVANELNTMKYEIEKSKNSQQGFEKIGSVEVVENSIEHEKNYHWIDVAPTPAIYFYRIKQIDLSGKITFSKIIKIETGNKVHSIVVNPNLIVEGSIKLQFNQQPKGIYALQLKSSTGQLLFSQQINHSGGNRFQLINIDSQLSAGIYFLNIKGPDNIGKTLKILKQ